MTASANKIDASEIGGWLRDQGWKISNRFHPKGGIHFEVESQESTETFHLYSPQDGSLVFVTDYNLSPRQIWRLTRLEWHEYLDLVWELRRALFSEHFYHRLNPAGCELRQVRAGRQLWDPEITKNEVLQTSVRMLDLHRYLHSLLESHLSTVEPWELESNKARPPPPGDRPTVPVG